MTLVTIVIPFYNDPFVQTAVGSALAQTHGELEILVVDDGSERHAELLEPYAGRIHYVGKANGGTASALNHGFRMASGLHIAWLSSDDMLYPHKVARQLSAMTAKGAWISHTAFDVIDRSGRVTERHVPPFGEDPGRLYREFAYGNPVNGCTVMMRKQLFELLGGFDENLPYTHDLDFWYRAMLAGFPFHYMNEPLTAYRRHDGMGTVRHREAIMQEVQATMARYAAPWRQFLHRIGEPAV